MQIANNPTFTNIYDKFAKGPVLDGGKHLRSDGVKLYTHNPLVPHGKGQAALDDRNAKKAGVAAEVKAAIVREHGPDVANAVFSNLHLTTGPTSSVTLSDLKAMKAQIKTLTTVDLGRHGGGAEAMLKAAVTGSDPALAADFEKFVVKNKARENLDFLRAVHDYEQEPTAEKARNIADTFFDGGPAQVNPADRDSRAREMFAAARERMAQNPAGKDTFEELRGEVFDMTAFDLMARYTTDVQTKGR